MNLETIRELLEGVKAGEQTIDQALEFLARLPYEEIDQYAKIDHHRALRRGIPETIFGQGKTAEQVKTIFCKMAGLSRQVMATRITEEVYLKIKDQVPADAIYHPVARVLYLNRSPEIKKNGGILVMAAGTSDLPVAEEAAITAELMGNQVERVYDVGVAGIHRLFEFLSVIRQANVIVVAAGMEGALPSVVAGLTPAPVIAVPTSIGYGASFQGLAALLAMLNSCSNGIAVVNIDNGFGAGTLAGMINRLAIRGEGQ